MIKIKTILHYGGSCPFQLDALTSDNRLIYGRYRHGWLEVRIGAKDDASEDAVLSGESIFREKIGENFDGYIDIEQFKLETEEFIDWSEAFDQHTLEREVLLVKLRNNQQDQLKANLKYWENITLKSHLVVAAASVPVFVSDSVWAVAPLVLAFFWFIFCFFKHMSAKHKFLTFGREN